METSGHRRARKVDPRAHDHRPLVARPLSRAGIEHLQTRNEGSAAQCQQACGDLPGGKVNGTDAVALLPLILLAGTPVLVMMGIAVRRSHGLTLGLTLAGLAAAFGSIWIAAPLARRQVTILLVIDNYALFYFGLLIAAVCAIAILSYDYLKKHDIHREELYILLLIATLGAAVLVASSHFASFFLGLETLSVSLYAMVSYLRPAWRPLEAGIKYLVLAAASAAFLLFGMALIYA